MAERSGGWIPLFPLQLVLLPGALLPLHIFEPRYRAMIRRCLHEALPFGVLWLREQNLAQVGCEARIEKVLKTYEDGRLDILARGSRRFALLELREHADGYLEGHADEVTDVAGETEPGARVALSRLYAECRRLLEDAEEPPSFESLADEAEDPSGLAYRLAAAVQMDLGDRQALLETLSEGRREQLLIGHLARLIPQLRALNENRRRIRGNGKPESPA